MAYDILEADQPGYEVIEPVSKGYDVIEPALSDDELSNLTRDLPVDPLAKAVQLKNAQIAKQDAPQMGFPNDPEANRAEFSKLIDVPTEVSRAALTDALNVGDVQGNLLTALKNANRDTSVNPNPEPLPIDLANAEMSKYAPKTAIAAKIVQGGLGALPLAAVGGLPAWAQKLAALGFTAQMIKGGGDAATALGTELGKNPEDRNPDAITSSVSDLVQTFGFAPFAGLHGTRDIVERYADKPTYAIRALSKQLQDAPSIPVPPANLKPAALSANPFDQFDQPQIYQSPASQPAPPAEEIQPSQPATGAATPPAPVASTEFLPNATPPEETFSPPGGAAGGQPDVGTPNPAAGAEEIPFNLGNQLENGQPESVNAENTDGSSKPSVQPPTSQEAGPTKIVHEEKAGIYGSRYINAIINGHPWKIRIADHEAGQSSNPPGEHSARARKESLLNAATIKNENPFTLDWQTDDPQSISFDDVVNVIRRNVADEFYTHEDARFGGNVDVKGEPKSTTVEVEGDFQKENAPESEDASGTFSHIESREKSNAALPVPESNLDLSASSSPMVKSKETQPQSAEPVNIQKFNRGDKVVHEGQIKTVTQDVGADHIGVGKRAVKRSSVRAATPEEIQTGKVQEPETAEFIGMGGATPSEFINSPQTPTGIKNITTDAERAKRGLPPAMNAARKSFGATWDEAMARIDNDPSAQDELIHSLREHPRALTDVEDAMLLHRQIDLQNQYGKVTRDLAHAYDDAKEFPNRLADVEELKLQAAKLSDQLYDLYEINRRVGTETGRGLAARKMMAYEDYSLAAMELQKRAANDGRPLTPKENAQLKTQSDRIAELERQLGAHQQRINDDRAKRMADEALLDMVKKVNRDPTVDKHVLSLADRIISTLDKQAEVARMRLKEKFSRFNAGLDPTVIYDLSLIGASHIARGLVDFGRWSKTMVADLGNKVTPYLEEAWKSANLRLDNEVAKIAKGETAEKVKRVVRKQDAEGTRQNIIAGLKAAKADVQPLDLQGDYIRKLAENFVRSGIKKRDELVDAVHEVLVNNFDPEITRRETMDAISGYGKFKPLDPDAVKATLRDLKGQMQQVAKLEDLQARQPLRKTGVERRAPSDEERRLIKQVNESKRRLGVVTTDPARQLKSALDAIKTRLRNSIADLEFQIASKQKIVKTRTPTPYDQEAELLKVKRDELKRQYDEIFARPDLTDAQRIQRAMRAVQSSIEMYEARLKNKDISERRTVTPASPELEAVRARRDALRQEFETMRDALDPQRQDRLANQVLKTRLRNSIANYQERLARGDFAPRKRNAPRLDAESQRLQAEANRVKQDFQRALITDRLAKRTRFEKVQDTFVKWRRGFLLSSPVTLAKLTAAAAQRFLFTPLEEVVGAGIGKMIPSIASRAPREGGFNSAAEAKALTEGFTQGMTDAATVLKTGKGNLDLLYGGRKDGAIGESDVLPRSVIDFLGQIHGALKSPVKRAEFARSFEKRTAFAIRNGVDASDPMVQTRLAVEAYKDANRSIFLQDNRIVSAYKRALTAFEEKSKVTGRVTMGGKIAATTARTLLPIVRVPTNIVAETFQYALGSVSGVARLGLALRRGVETLSPEEADLIMRHLKKGSIGGALLLAGFLLPNYVGGYYQPGEKRDAKDVKPGEIKIFGMNVPSFLLHNPALETLQIGATIRRVADSKLRKQDQQGQGVLAGTMAGLLGLLDEVPFVREQFELGSLRDPNSRHRFFGELLKSITVPQFIQWLAVQTDRDNEGEKVKRSPQTILQHVETGIPRLRENVIINDPRVSNYMRKIRGGSSAERQSIRAAFSQNIQNSWTNQPDTNGLLNRAMQR